MTKQTALEDLFLSVKKHLLESGRNLSTAIMVADKVVAEAQDASIEDIKKMRDVFLA